MTPTNVTVPGTFCRSTVVVPDAALTCFRFIVGKWETGEHTTDEAIDLVAKLIDAYPSLGSTRLFSDFALDVIEDPLVPIRHE